MATMILWSGGPVWIPNNRQMRELGKPGIRAANKCEDRSLKIVVAGEVDFPPQNRTAVLAGERSWIDMALAEKGCRHYARTPESTAST